ncbi:hypothetical protein Tco_0915781 [Tanacetum coccineum]
MMHQSGYNVSKPLPLGGEPGHVTIQPDFFFNKDLEYLRLGRKGGDVFVNIEDEGGIINPDVGLEHTIDYTVIEAPKGSYIQRQIRGSDDHENLELLLGGWIREGDSVDEENRMRGSPV